MISIIISTNNEERFKSISENVRSTIGKVEYEIIEIKNSKKYSLCQAYNIGLDKSKFDFLCFMHDDIVFKVVDWGVRLVNLLSNDSNIGLVGVVGNKFKSTYPSAIGQGELIKRKFMRGHIYQDTKGYMDLDCSKTKNEVEDVVCVDGVFLFTKKEVFRVCRFDENMLDDFHGYDIDFSLQVFFQKYRVVVDRGVLIEHFSKGNYSEQNTYANRAIVAKWMKKLPVASKDLKLNKIKLYYYNYQNWVYFVRNAIRRKIIKQ